MDLCTVWNTNDISEKIWKSIKRNCVWLLKRGVDLTIRRKYEDLSGKKCTVHKCSCIWKWDYIYHDLEESCTGRISCSCRQQVFNILIKFRIVCLVFLTLFPFLCYFLSRSLALLVRHGSRTISKNQLLWRTKHGVKIMSSATL